MQTPLTGNLACGRLSLGPSNRMEASSVALPFDLVSDLFDVG